MSLWKLSSWEKVQTGLKEQQRGLTLIIKSYCYSAGRLVAVLAASTNFMNIVLDLLSMTVVSLAARHNLCMSVFV